MHSTIPLSDMLPVYYCSMNVKDPLFEIPTSPFRGVMFIRTKQFTT